MPAARAKSVVVGVMTVCSHITNIMASIKVRTMHNDGFARSRYDRRMARRGVPKDTVHWFIREWMDTLGVKQAEMCRRTGWSKASASQIYNGLQDYSPPIVRQAAIALNVADYELLMKPEEAMAIRRLRASAETIVSIAHENDDLRNGTEG